MHETTIRDPLIEPLLTGRETAERLKIAYPTLMAWSLKDTGPPVYVLTDAEPGDKRTRRVVRYRASEVENWLKTRRRGA